MATARTSAGNGRKRKANGRKAAGTSGRSMRQASGRQTSGRASGSRQDAIALLKADHREVEGWFEQFEKSNSDSKKADLARRICRALTVHATIEEELFYPAFLEATDDKDIHHEAEIEHEGAKRLIADIENSGPDDDHFDARVTVLAEMIKHHVREEEKPGGMFAKARKSDMDLKQLGEDLQARKMSLQNGRGGASTRRPRGKPMASLGMR